MKTSELTGAALDWAVAKCEGYSGLDWEGWLVRDGIPKMPLEEYAASSDWSQGGPIIEREDIGLISEAGNWKAEKCYSLREGHLAWAEAYGPTPLIAAMRCYVTSRLGDEVTIPEELQ